MSNLRIFWVIWCCGWALFWMLMGFFTLLLGWLLVPVSLALILVPMGQTPQLPACTNCGYPAQAHTYGQCPPYARRNAGDVVLHPERPAADR